MTMKKIFAAVLAVMMVLAFASCGGKEQEPETTQPEAPEVTEANLENEEIQLDDALTTAAPAAETDAAEDAAQTEPAGQTDAAAVTEAADAAEAETTEAASKTPETKEEIVEFYKAAAAASDKAGVKTSNTMKLEDLQGGSGAVGAFVNLLEPIVRSTLERNSSTDDHITGGYKNLTADDVVSATAKDDGKYTTVTILLKEQTDGMNGKSKEGHVGHGVSVLNGMQQAIDELNGVDVDASGGTLSVRYNNAKINVKVDNATGRIVSGTWYYRANATIDNVKAKIGILSVTLKGASAVISQTVTL